MRNIFGEPLLTDTVNKEWLFMKEHPIILNIQKSRNKFPWQVKVKLNATEFQKE